MKPQKPTIHGPIVTEVVADGQRYLDIPVYQDVPVYCGLIPMKGKAPRYYTRTPLRWKKPERDALGNFVRDSHGKVRLVTQ